MTRANNTDLKDVWQTPDEIIEMLQPIDVDPCAGRDTIIGQDANYTKADDGLTKKWHGRVFVNPPFSDKKSWLQKSISEKDRTEVIFVLTPDGTDTKSWWHEYIAEHANYIWFSRGRISFREADGTVLNSPTFGTAISVFGETTDEMLKWFDENGHLVRTINT